MTSIKYLVLHHSAFSSDYPQFNSISYWHEKRNWGTAKYPLYASRNLRGNYVQYSYICERSGQITQCRNESEAGWHCGDREINKHSISICIAGNLEIEEMTKEQEYSLANLLTSLCSRYKIKRENIKLHNEISQTLCPGRNFTQDTINELTNMAKHIIIGSEQYILIPSLRIALSIPDEKELELLKKRGLKGEPEVLGHLPQDYATYSFSSQDRLKLFFNI